MTEHAPDSLYSSAGNAPSRDTRKACLFGLLPGEFGGELSWPSGIPNAVELIRSTATALRGPDLHQFCCALVTRLPRGVAIAPNNTGLIPPQGTRSNLDN